MRVVDFLLIAGLAILIVILVETSIILSRSEPASSVAADFDRMRGRTERLLSAIAPAGETLLAQKDFKHGTYRIREPGVYKLVEDVLFEPAAAQDWRADRALYPDPAYRLDFFAAITVEARDVIIDLQGHEIAQSPVHALQQRFFALIEVASRPFVQGQGPADFGADFNATAADGLIVRNGRLGRSSHHGIHGNDCRRVLLEDLEISQYEVAAVALNGCQDVLMRNVQALGSFERIPVLGTYSNARFLVPFVDEALRLAAGTSAEGVQELRGAFRVLQQQMDDVLTDVKATGFISKTKHRAAYSLFANPTGLVDGNSYGFLFNGRGVAVNGFADSLDLVKTSQRIIIENCRVAAVPADIVEVVCLATKDAFHTIMGPVGDRLRLIDNTGHSLIGSGPGGPYSGNALADTQIALMKVVSGLPEHEQARFGTLTRDTKIVELLWSWSKGEMTLEELYADEHGLVYLRNGDTMFHTNKGVVGLRIDNSAHVIVSGLVVDRIHNDSPLGRDAALPGETSAAALYEGAHDGGHPSQAPQAGYMGCDARGVAVAASHHVWLSSVDINSVRSAGGHAFGVDVFNRARDVFVDDVSVNAVSSDCSSGSIMKKPLAMGVRIASDTKNVQLSTEDLQIDGVACEPALGQAMNVGSDSSTETQRLREAAPDIDASKVYQL